MRALTYCSNIHAGEAWADVLHNLDAHLLAVKQQVSPDHPFPLGLRIAHQAAMEINAQDIHAFHDWCHKHDCFLLTINGFPYGPFHQQAVKAAVYQPDWRTEERVTYTQRLADLAIALMTTPTEISISTVPVAFKPDFADGDWDCVRNNFISVLEYLHDIHTRTGHRVRLAIEPEPYCVLETTSETVEFFARMNFPLSLRQYVGVCFDCCHQAVEFEDPSECLKQLRAADIAIVKVQVSSALRARGDEIAQLHQFNEPIYLHQVVAQSDVDQPLARFPDLLDFQLQLDTGANFSECRAHFHVPIFLDHLGYCGTTRFFLEAFLPKLHPDIPLEVETYSFQNLPAHLRKDSVSDSITRELLWVRELLQQS
jgi:Xylose isomerase-like TIM barrel